MILIIAKFEDNKDAVHIPSGMGARSKRYRRGYSAGRRQPAQTQVVKRLTARRSFAPRHNSGNRRRADQARFADKYLEIVLLAVANPATRCSGKSKQTISSCGVSYKIIRFLLHNKCKAKLRVAAEIDDLFLVWQKKLRGKLRDGNPRVAIDTI